MVALALVGAGVAVVAGLVHLIWAAGFLQDAMAVTLPTDADGVKALDPGPLAAIGVASLLFLYAAVVVARALGEAEPWWTRTMVGAAAVILSLRVIGDRRWVGLTKTVRGTTFARWDDRLFIPIVVLLVLAAIAALAA